MRLALWPLMAPHEPYPRSLVRWECNEDDARRPEPALRPVARAPTQRTIEGIARRDASGRGRDGGGYIIAGDNRGRRSALDLIQVEAGIAPHAEDG